MGFKGTLAKTNFVLGEVSPRIKGRFDSDKPIFKNSAAILENMLILQAGSVMFRPGTKFIAEVKDSTKKVRLERFRYSISQEYVLEIGANYIRFFANEGQVVVSSAAAWVTATPYTAGTYLSDSGNIYYVPEDYTSGATVADDVTAGDLLLQDALEIPTIFGQQDIFFLQMANKSDVMYIVNTNYPPQKLIRTSATSFTISDVPFVRGPFLDDNITATTITPDSATGAVTLTSSASIFQAGHVGALWRVKDGVVKIEVFNSSTSVDGTVQAEPDGTSGDLGTTSPVTDWAEGAFSYVRGFPTAVTFHEQRLVYGGTLYQPQTFYGSVAGAYDNFDKGAASDADAYIFTIASNVVNDIRWLDSDTALKIGTSGGTISASSGVVGINPANPPNITIDTDTGVMQTQPVRLGGYLFYLQANQFNLRQLTFDLIINKDKTNDMNLLADHILRDGQGAVQMARQQSPNDRIWIIRTDGQIAILTRNPDQQVTGWCRVIGGESDFTASCNGLSGGFETITVLPIDGADDQVWVVCQRLIGGTFKRFVEVFTEELFQEYWEPVRLDSSLSLNEPIMITGISNTDPMVVTAPSHGLSDGDFIKLNGIIGMEFLNDNVYQAFNVTTNTFDLYEPV